MYKTRLEGRRYGRLQVLGLEDVTTSPKGKKYYRYRCICDCGTECVVPGSCLVNGKTQSCGCIRKEKSKERLLANKAEYERRRRENIEARRETGRRIYEERDFTFGSLLRYNGDVCVVKAQRKDSVEIWSPKKMRHYYIVATRYQELEAIPVTWGGLVENGFKDNGDKLVLDLVGGYAEYDVYSRILRVEGPRGFSETYPDYLHQVQRAVSFCGYESQAKAFKA